MGSEGESVDARSQGFDGARLGIDHIEVARDDPAWHSNDAKWIARAAVEAEG